MKVIWLFIVLFMNPGPMPGPYEAHFFPTQDSCVHVREWFKNKNADKLPLYVPDCVEAEVGGYDH